MSDQDLYKHVKLPPIGDNIPKSRMYRGFTTVDPSDSWKKYDIEIVKQDLLNHFHIRQGEKLNDPTFGTIIWDLLYEPLTDQVRRMILEDVTRIVNYDPRTKAELIEIHEAQHGIEIACTLTYINYKITETFNLRFDRY